MIGRVTAIAVEAAGAGRSAPWPRPWPWWRVAAPLVVVAALALRLPHLDGDLADHDTWRQTDTASIASNFLEEPRILWPRIDWGAPGPGYVESEFQLYPFAVSLLYRVLGEDPLWGRLLSLLLAGLACLPFWRIARRYLDGPAALAALGFFVLSPVVFRYSRAFMPDATALFFLLLALERFLAALDDGRWATMLTAAVAMALGVLIKPTTAHVGLLLLILAAARGGRRLVVSWRALAFVAIVVVPAAAWYARAAWLHEVYGNTFGVLSGGDSKWGSPSLWLDPVFWKNLARIDARWDVGVAGAVLSLAGLVAWRAPGWRTLTLSWAGVLLAYELIVARYAGFESRGLQYHLFAAPLGALAAAGGLAAARDMARGPVLRHLAVAGLVMAVGLVEVRRDAQVLGMRNPLPMRAGLALARVSRPDETALVLSHDVEDDGGVPNNYQEPDVFFHARRTGRVLPADRQTARDLTERLSAGERWFVNFPALNRRAEPSFLEVLRDRMDRVVQGDGFEVWEVRPVAAATAVVAAAPEAPKHPGDRVFETAVANRAAAGTGPSRAPDLLDTAFPRVAQGAALPVPSRSRGPVLR